MFENTLNYYSKSNQLRLFLASEVIFSLVRLKIRNCLKRFLRFGRFHCDLCVVLPTLPRSYQEGAQVRWVKSHDSCRRIASESYRPRCESLAFVGSYISLQTQKLVLIGPAFVVLRSPCPERRKLVDFVRRRLLN